MVGGWRDYYGTHMPLRDHYHYHDLTLLEGYQLRMLTYDADYE
jgi:hypothetical protein